jgi:hypothetical protein
VSFRIHGVSAEYVRAFKQLGYESLTADQLVSMRIHGVTPEFAKELGRSATRVSRSTTW